MNIIGEDCEPNLNTYISEKWKCFNGAVLLQNVIEGTKQGNTNILTAVNGLFFADDKYQPNPVENAHKWSQVYKTLSTNITIIAINHMVRKCIQREVKVYAKSSPINWIA